MSEANKERLGVLLKLLELDPKDAFLAYGVALEYLALGELEEAEARLCALKAQQPNYLPLYYQLAEVYELQGRTGLAQLALQEGMVVAEAQNERRTLGELRAALEGLG